MKKISTLLLSVFVSISICAQTPNVLRLKIVGAGTSDETVMRLKSGATFGFDGNYDAFKLISTLAPQIYSVLTDGTMLSINSIPLATSEYEFPISIRVYSEGLYNINSTGMLSLSSSIGLYLIDRSTNTIRNLRRDSLYTIAAKPSDNYDRFIMKLTSRPANPSTFSAIAANSNQIDLSIIPNSANSNMVVVYNTTGYFTTPIDGIAAGATNTSFGGGTILYNGVGTISISHLGLIPNQRIYYKVFQYNSMNMFSTGSTANALTPLQPIISTASDLISFENQAINTFSSAQSFSVSGSNLSSNMTIIPPARFQISTLSGTNFIPSDSIVLSPVSGTISTTNLYIRFNPNEPKTYSENITVKCSGVANHIPVSGIGISLTKTVTLKLYLEGLYYAPTGMMNEVMDGNTNLPAWGYGIADKIQVELRESASPHNVAFMVNDLDLSTNGFASFDIPSTFSGNYFINVNNRNHLETWSSTAISFTGNAIQYVFSDGMDKAYGTNAQTQLETGIYGLLLGDLNQDGTVDLNDYSLFEPDLTNGSTGYLISDFDGNGYVDLIDFGIFSDRLASGTTSQFPE